MGITILFSLLMHRLESFHLKTFFKKMLTCERKQYSEYKSVTLASPKPIKGAGTIRELTPGPRSKPNRSYGKHSVSESQIKLEIGASHTPQT